MAHTGGKGTQNRKRRRHGTERERGSEVTGSEGRGAAVVLKDERKDRDSKRRMDVAGNEKDECTMIIGICPGTMGILKPGLILKERAKIWDNVRLGGDDMVADRCHHAGVLNQRVCTKIRGSEGGSEGGKEGDKREKEERGTAIKMSAKMSTGTRDINILDVKRERCTGTSKTHERFVPCGPHSCSLVTCTSPPPSHSPPPRASPLHLARPSRTREERKHAIETTVAMES
jgi:hypothetical protein